MRLLVACLFALIAASKLSSSTRDRPEYQARNVPAAALIFPALQTHMPTGKVTYHICTLSTECPRTRRRKAKWIQLSYSAKPTNFWIFRNHCRLIFTP